MLRVHAGERRSLLPSEEAPVHIHFRHHKDQKELMMSEFFAVILAMEAMMGVAALAAAQNASIWEESGLRMFCVIGSILGGVLAVLIWPDDANDEQQVKTAQRKVAAKFFCSAIGGLLFTPLAFRWANIEFSVDYVLAISGVVAFLTVATLQVFVQSYEKFIRKRLEKRAIEIANKIESVTGDEK